MALVLRTGLTNCNPTGLLGGLCKLTSKTRNVAVAQVAFITGRELRKNRPPRPPPFDWRHKTYSRWYYFTDPMEERFDDNSKLIIVEGLPGVGKDKFAKKLAEELEMKYIPAPTFDDIWINPYGYDLRSLNPTLPPDCQFYDVKGFLENPNGRNSAAMQVGMLVLRLHQYIDALAHILSTGEGVVLQRCPWSDSTFVNAMVQSGFMSRGAQDYYRCSALAGIQDILKPHLLIYLDAPTSVIKDNIKKRNIPYEVNSKALTDKYLEDLASAYKEDYLKNMSAHAHLLIYDWSTEGDISVVVEDIERLDFDDISSSNLKLRDWHYDDVNDIKQRRYDYTVDKHLFILPVMLARFDVPEMLISGQDDYAFHAAWAEIDEQRFAPGFHPKYDKGVLWKTKEHYEDTLPRGCVAKQQK